MDENIRYMEIDMDENIRYMEIDMDENIFKDTKEILANTKYLMNTISKGSAKIIEYADPKTEEPLKTFVQNGILGFWATEKEMHDLVLLLNYYLNIEAISEIE